MSASLLNTEQQAAVQAVKDGKSIFLTGSPGTGKSFTLGVIIKYLKDAKIKYAVTSSTGCSAVIIGGQTIHSYLGLGIGNKPVDKIVANMKNKKNVQELKVLILDEISMLDDSTFTKISDVLKKIKGNRAPFGSLQVILVGDFCQLAPVQGNYCFTSDVWQELNPQVIQLTTLVRQKDDKEFQEILQEVRFAKCSKKTFTKLKQLQDTQFAANGVVPTRLYPLNPEVNAINNMHFHNLYLKNNKISSTEAHIVQCWPRTSLDPLDTLSDYSDIAYDTNKDIFRYNALTNDKKSQNVDDYRIDLFKGLQVMVTRNVNFETGLINGTTGVITELTPSSVTIQSTSTSASGNIHHTIYYHKDLNENNNIHIKFMPIKLAYALSIHKSQGATLDAIEVDASANIFAPGQLYTALSRAKRLDCIRLLNLDEYSFMCNKSVKEFYNKLVP